VYYCYTYPFFFNDNSVEVYKTDKETYPKLTPVYNFTARYSLSDIPYILQTKLIEYKLTQEDEMNIQKYLESRNERYNKNTNFTVLKFSGDKTIFCNIGDKSVKLKLINKDNNYIIEIQGNDGKINISKSGNFNISCENDHLEFEEIPKTPNGYAIKDDEAIIGNVKCRYKNFKIVFEPKNYLLYVLNKENLKFNTHINLEVIKELVKGTLLDAYTIDNNDIVTSTGEIYGYNKENKLYIPDNTKAGILVTKIEINPSLKKYFEEIIYRKFLYTIESKDFTLNNNSYTVVRTYTRYTIYPKGNKAEIITITYKGKGNISCANIINSSFLKFQNDLEFEYKKNIISKKSLLKYILMKIYNYIFIKHPYIFMFGAFLLFISMLYLIIIFIIKQKVFSEVKKKVWNIGHIFGK
jgi:hypothetical protein